jgi:SAM-dependent methyltransferase
VALQRTDLSVLAARLRAVPRHLRAMGTGLLPVPSVDKEPANPLAWIGLANRRVAELGSSTRDLMENYELRPGSYQVRLFLPEISAGSADTLAGLHRDGVSPSTIAAAIDEIIRWQTIAQCAYAHRAGSYFDVAEPVIGRQWDQTIWPIICDEDFSNTLDLACGHGRNTEMLRKSAQTIDLVDVNASCIEFCRRRFGDQNDQCRFRYHLTDGNGLPAIGDETITFVYSWVSMVHFDKLVIRNYLFEIARVLRSGGSAFLHHSNYGVFAPNSDWTKNHGSRSDMTASLMREYADDARLKVKFQRLSGTTDGWGMDDLDCLTLLQK